MINKIDCYLYLIIYITKFSSGTFKKLDNCMALFSISAGFNKNCAGNNGISRLSFKTNKILHRGLSPCFIKNFKFFIFLNSYDKKTVRFFPEIQFLQYEQAHLVLKIRYIHSQYSKILLVLNKYLFQ